MTPFVSSRSAVAVFGPTCVGKTALGIKIAQAINGEILSIDSLQCYRDGAILTAQPTSEEQAEAPHHLVGYLDPSKEPQDDFQERVRCVLHELEGRSKIPVLVGGSTSLTLPILLDMSDRGYNILMLVLQPPTAGRLYLDRLWLRIEDMVAQGMLDEIGELHRLRSCAGLEGPMTGVWKAIGYPELLPYVTCLGDDVYRYTLLTDGLKELCIKSLQYGHHQMRWINETLQPQLDDRKIEFHTLEIADFAPDTIASFRSKALKLVASYVDGTKLEYGSPAIKSATQACNIMQSDMPFTRYAMDAQNDSDALSSVSSQSTTEFSESYTSDFTCSTSHLNASSHSDFHTASTTPKPTENALDKTGHQVQRVVCVFAGSSSGSSLEHITAARSLAYEFHRENVKLVYGGGTTGLMGVLASTLVSLSGPLSVRGIVPEALARYEATVTGEAVADVKESKYGIRVVVPDMHTRKKMMVDCVLQGGHGSGFIALSGGYGTLEELMEMVTWKQLGIHSASICILNSRGFYDGLLHFLDASVKGEGFVKGEDGEILEVAETAADALEKLYSQKLVGRGNLLKWSKA